MQRIENLKKQTIKLRSEADASKGVEAKLGGISNAEEKEAELLVKQNVLITELKKLYPTFVSKGSVKENENVVVEIPQELLDKKKQNTTRFIFLLCLQ